MAQINLGRIGIVPKGEWNNIFTYNRLDLVAYAGGGYVSLVDNNNNKLPTDTAYWLQIAEKGETGNIENLNAQHIEDALGYIPANETELDEHMADYATHKAENAPHAETVNRTITVGVGKDFTTISAAIKSIKKRVDAIIRINVDAGVYNETVNIEGFTGGGALNITGGATLEDAQNYSIRSLFCSSNTLKITFSGFTSTLDTGRAFRMNYCYGFTISSCRAETVDTTEAGFYIAGGNVVVSQCIASNRSAALYATNGAIVFSNAWEAGTNNVRGIWCRAASTVGKYGTQPSGTTLELADQGGAIR